MSVRLFAGALLFATAMSAVASAGGGPPISAPELAPGTVGEVFTLIGGVLLLLKQRAPRL